MTGSDNDLAQALLNIQDLRTATQALRSDLNDEHANNDALVKTTRSDFEHHLNVLRDNTSQVLSALVVLFKLRFDALRDHLTTLLAGQINTLTVETKDIRAEARVIAENSKAARDNLADMLRKRIDDHSASNRAYTAELCAQLAKELDEKFRDVLAKRDATRRN
jgi:hypothetical protein